VREVVLDLVERQRPVVDAKFVDCTFEGECAVGVGDPRIPRPIGEDRGGMIGCVHRSPVKIWARMVEAA
jgi:hypothetical protein